MKKGLVLITLLFQIILVFTKTSNETINPSDLPFYEKQKKNKKIKKKKI